MSRPFGWHLFVNAAGAVPERIDDDLTIEHWIGLLPSRIGMKAWGGPQLTRFVLDNPRLSGVTALQYLTESHILCHFAPNGGEAYLDLFTCGEVASPSKLASDVCSSLHESFLIRYARWTITSRDIEIPPLTYGGTWTPQSA